MDKILSRHFVDSINMTELADLKSVLKRYLTETRQTPRSVALAVCIG